MSEVDNARDIAVRVSVMLGDAVTDEQINPVEVMIGASRAIVVFWMGCVQDGARYDGLQIMRQALNEEIDGIARGIANGMVPG